MKYKLTWRRQKNEQGLARISQAPRGYDLYINGQKNGSISFCSYRGFIKQDGWMWSIGSNETLNIEWANSAAKGEHYCIYNDIEDAKAALKAYVLKCLEGIQE